MISSILLVTWSSEKIHRETAEFLWVQVQYVDMVDNHEFTYCTIAANKPMHYTVTKMRYTFSVNESADGKMSGRTPFTTVFAPPVH